MATPKSYKWAANLAKKEGTFGTQIADAALTDWYSILGPPDFAKVTRQWRTDEGEINGFAGPTEHEIERKEGALGRKAQCSIELLTGLLALMFGNVTTSGSSDPRTHVIAWPNICTINPPSFSFVEMQDCSGLTGTFLLYKGCVVDQITLTDSGNAFIELDFNIKTDGSETGKSSFTPPSAVTTVKKLLSAQRTLKYGPLGTENITSLLRIFKMVLNLGTGIPPNVTSSGLVPEYQIGEGKPSIEVDFEMKADKSHAIYGYADAGTKAILDYTIDPGVSPARSFNLHMSQTLAEAEAKPQGNETRLGVKIMPEFNSTDGGPAKFTCKNAVAAYLVASP